MKSNHKIQPAKMLRITFFTKILLLATLTPLLLFSQVNWTRVTSGPVLTVGPEGSWDEGIAFICAVIKDGDTLKMWYTGSHSGYTGPDPMHIGYAWSLDGIHWTKYEGNPVLSPRPGMFDGGGLAAPIVIKDGDTLRMWYAAIAEGEPPKIPPPRGGYAWSIDGIHWQRLSEPVLVAGPKGSWDDVICNPGAVIKENGLFKMYYLGGTYVPGYPQHWPFVGFQVGLATSTDGIHWTKYNDPATGGEGQSLYNYSDPIIKAMPVSMAEKPWAQARIFMQTILRTENGYETWASGEQVMNQTFFTSIGYLTSSDGMHWKFYPDNPVLSPTFTWTTSVEWANVIRIGDTYHMWYTANKFPGAEIAYAVAPVAKPEPVIVEVEDVPNDQGRQVRISWNASRFDGVAPEQSIVEYTIWRKVDQQVLGKAAVSSLDLARHPGGMAAIEGSLWDFVATIPAHQFARYAFIAPTLGDATPKDTTFSTFMVTAHTVDPTKYFDSDPATGFSLDNLAPATPKNFKQKETQLNGKPVIILSWDKSEEADFAFFTLYKDGQLLTQTTSTSYTDTQINPGEFHEYLLSASDFNGNESDKAQLSLNITALNQSDLNVPKQFALYQNEPNPFNPETSIGFDLPAASVVTIEVYNILGEKVVTLVNRHFPAGHHKIRWNSRDGRNNPVPGGIYFYQLHTPQYTASRKMILIR
ncbi:MAG: T9SS C-terminal target domain-containing protein [Calditrichaeota bacterium]|nr:MAG: T9SS C-terminal target domain-containing protein [Calditrichota bacterium]